jgi:hypothetical protein
MAERKNSKKSTTSKSSKPRTPSKTRTPSKAPSEFAVNSYVEFDGKKVNIDEIQKTIKTLYSQKLHKKLSTLEIYINIAESKAYYVANGVSNPDYFVEL